MRRSIWESISRYSIKGTRVEVEVRKSHWIVREQNSLQALCFIRLITNSILMPTISLKWSRFLMSSWQSQTPSIRSQRAHLSQIGPIVICYTSRLKTSFCTQLRLAISLPLSFRLKNLTNFFKIRALVLISPLLCLYHLLKQQSKSKRKKGRLKTYRQDWRTILLKDKIFL